MFYLIRLDCERPDGPSYSDLRETWHRTVAAMRGTSGPETFRSFKVVGRRTIFALIECDDTDALDDALAELSIVEDLGGAVELEVMPVRSYDEPEATAAQPEVPAEPEATTVPPEDALVTDEIRSLYEKPAGPEEQTTEVQAPPEAEPEGLISKEIDDSEAGEPPGEDIGTGEETGVAPEREQPEGLVAGLIENFDGLDEAPTEPAEQEAFPEETGEIESPEDSPVSGLSSDSPGREFSVAEEPAGPEAVEEHAPDVDRPAQPKSPPAQPENPSVTGMIRNLDSPGHAREETTRREVEDEAPRHTPTEPASPAWLEKDPGAHQEVEAAPEQLEGSSVTGMIRNLDSPGHLPDAPHEESAKPKALSESRVLLRVAGRLSGEVHEINQTGATMGRSFDNSIRLDDEMLSRRHALIEFRDGDFWLSDLGSSNGTFVNDTRLNAPHKLQSWDVIELGSTRLDVTLEDAAI